ncbi:phosphatidate cytidylyltransferase [Micromonospora mangrovi]|uniref:Phosphatidate cytidylyltransferase n=2 Tax=Micromonospora TaxID=1873 RepID=A0AAU8H9R1_9ACTN
MSHPDPYGAADPRGWDRPDRPPALPWPETDLEPGPRRRPGGNPEAYAEPHRRPRPTVDPYAEPYARPDVDRHEPARAGRPAPYTGQLGGPDERPGAYDERAGRVDGRSGRDRDDHDEPGRDDEYPTAQLAPVRADAAPDPEPAAPAGRRARGRRRASADRPPTLQAAPSRAGRNLPAAIGVGLGLGAVILVPLFFYPLAFLGVIAAAVAVGTWEMARAVRRSGAHPPLVPLIAGGVLTVGLAWFAGPDALSLGLLVTVLGTMIWRLGDGPGNYQRDLTAATLIAVYVPFLAGFAAMLAAAPGDGRLRVLATLVAVVLSDTGGYAAGVSFGKHPMAPSISPKKSWEGFAGSVTAAAVGSAVLIWLFFDVAPWWGALFGVAVSCAAVLGDLAESMIKRDLGVKDMSNLLPGHGGLMDRLDSILFAVPTAYLLLAVFAPLAG